MSLVAEAAGGEVVHLVVAHDVGAGRIEEVWVACISTRSHLPPSLIALIHCVPPAVPKEIMTSV